MKDNRAGPIIIVMILVALASSYFVLDSTAPARTLEAAETYADEHGCKWVGEFGPMCGRFDRQGRDILKCRDGKDYIATTSKLQIKIVDRRQQCTEVTF